MKAADIATMPPDDPARRAWILYQLALRGYSFAALGRELGTPRQTVLTALRRRYPAIEAVIARKLGVRPEQIWPERYDAQGRPRRKRAVGPGKFDQYGATTSARNAQRAGAP